MITALILTGTTLGVLALPSAYGYGETRGGEYRSDDRTALLLHFGPQIEFAKKNWGCTLFYIDANGVQRPVVVWIRR